jgi:hypothetical protein
MILKKSKSKWIEVTDFEGVKVKIDYPTIEQGEKIRELFFQVIFNNPNYTKQKEDAVIEVTPEQKAKEKILLEQLAKMNIRFCVKDWEGVNDEDGKPVECKIVKNEIEKDIYESFIRNFEYQHLIHLGNLIEEEIQFNEADKKK